MGVIQYTFRLCKCERVVSRLVLLIQERKKKDAIDSASRSTALATPYQRVTRRVSVVTGQSDVALRKVSEAEKLKLNAAGGRCSGSGGGGGSKDKSSSKSKSRGGSTSKLTPIEDSDSDSDSDGATNSSTLVYALDAARRNRWKCQSTLMHQVRSWRALSYELKRQTKIHETDDVTNSGRLMNIDRRVFDLGGSVAAITNTQTALLQRIEASEQRAQEHQQHTQAQLTIITTTLKEMMQSHGTATGILRVVE